MTDLTLADFDEYGHCHDCHSAALAAQADMVPPCGCAGLLREVAEASGAQALTEAADAWTQGEWGNAPRRRGRVAERIAVAQYVGDWLRARATET